SDAHPPDARQLHSLVFNPDRAREPEVRRRALAALEARIPGVRRPALQALEEALEGRIEVAQRLLEGALAHLVSPRDAALLLRLALERVELAVQLDGPRRLAASGALFLLAPQPPVPCKARSTGVARKQGPLASRRPKSY